MHLKRFYTVYVQHIERVSLVNLIDKHHLSDVDTRTIRFHVEMIAAVITRP